MIRRVYVWKYPLKCQTCGNSINTSILLGNVSHCSTDKLYLLSKSHYFFFSKLPLKNKIYLLSFPTGAEMLFKLKKII